MDTISPVVADAFSLLRMDLYGHLDEAEFLAEKGGEWSDQDRATARKLIPDLVIVIRGLQGPAPPVRLARPTGERWWVGAAHRSAGSCSPGWVIGPAAAPDRSPTAAGVAMGYGPIRGIGSAVGAGEENGAASGAHVAPEAGSSPSTG